MGYPAIDFTEVELPVALRFAERMSDDRLAQFSEQNRPFRIERNPAGEITIMSPVPSETGEHEAYVVAMLVLWNLKTRTGRVYSSNAGFDLPDGSCLSPDASWVRADRVRALTDQERGSFFPLCPDFVVEIRSKTDRRPMVEEKMTSWMENGAQFAWLIDPMEQSVSVYRAGEAVEVLERPDTVRGHAPVEGFVLDLGPIWNLDYAAS